MGKGPHDFIGFSVSDFLGEDIFEYIFKPNMMRCIGGENVRYKHWFEFGDGDGDARYMDVSYLSLHNFQGIIDLTVVISRDITHLKEFEGFLADHEKLTSVLALSYACAREIGNPLRDLNEYLEAASGATKDATIRENLEKARESTHRVADATEKIERMISDALKGNARETQNTIMEDESRDEA